MTTLNKGTWFWPDYSDSPPDAYFEQKWQERCDELDAQVHQELMDLAMMTETVNVHFAPPRPEVATIISNLMKALDDSSPCEASLKHLMEKAERICEQAVIVENEVIEGMDSSPYKRYTSHIAMSDID